VLCCVFLAVLLDALFYDVEGVVVLQVQAPAHLRQDALGHVVRGVSGSEVGS
jgi:hypothetical protein